TATPIANLQFAVGVLLGAWVIFLDRAARKRNLGGTSAAEARALQVVVTMARVLIGCIGIWLGSLEIDRLCAARVGRFSNPEMVRQMGLSIFWGLYAIGLVAIGFWRWARWPRYAGLALLAI